MCLFFHFSAAVEDGLKTGQLSTNLRNEFIWDVCIAILNHTRYPTKAERVQISKLIVQNYPCMGNKKLLDTSSTWVCSNTSWTRNRIQYAQEIWCRFLCVKFPIIMLPRCKQWKSRLKIVKDTSTRSYHTLMQNQDFLLQAIWA